MRTGGANRVRACQMRANRNVMHATYMCLLGDRSATVGGRVARTWAFERGIRLMPSLRTLGASVPRRASASLAALALTATLAAPLTAHADTSTGKSTGSTSASSGTPSVTVLQASAEARKSGKPVPVPGATTDTSTLTAEPNGSMALTETPVPVRKRVGGTWQQLDATLVRNADGSVSPKVSTDSLHLSGGGTGALATLAAGPDSVSITLPTRLPAPALSGATATYANIAPGVDLVVTANTQGGFSDVFVVHNASAAASTALANLLKETVTGTGVDVAEGHGALTATDRAGKAMFASNAPALWDSSTTSQSSSTGSPSRAQPRTASSTASPGTKAHIGALTPILNGRNLTLSPDQSVLHGSKTVYPVYIDPVWNPTEDGWSTVAEEYPSQKYWDTTAESEGYMAVGYGVSDYSLWARSMVNFSVPTATLEGSTITSAVFSATNEYSGACPDGGTDEQMNVDAPSQTLTSSNAMWDDWDTSSDIGSQIGYKSFAYGYSTSCSSGGSPSSASITLLTGTFSSDVSSGKSTQTLALVAANESSEYGWKEFIASTAKLTLTYDFPAQITSETTNSKGCGTASNPSLLGVGDIDLIAGVYQKDGSSLTANFRLYNAAKTTEYNPTSTSGATTGTASGVATTSGAKVPLTIKSTFFTGLNLTAQTTFAWTVQATDGTTAGTGSTATCYFTYDPTTPGEPVLYDAGGVNKCVVGATTYTVGTQASFVVDYNTSGSEPANYLYQLNGAAPISIRAISGDATITLKPTQGSNILTVTAVNASGNIGDPARCDFSAKAAATANDGDLTGDGTPDVLTTGTGNGMPNGLWLADGTNTGTVETTATDIGVNGAGLVGTADDYTGGQAITGQFTNNGFNDVLVYYPTGTVLNGTTAASSGTQGMIITGTGDGSDLQAQDTENANPLYSAALVDNNGLYPSQLVNAYHADTSNPNTDYPDLLGIAGNSSGYYLDYYPSSAGIGTYFTLSYGSNALTISMKTPDDTNDWNEWTIATTYVGSQVDMYLWNETTGALYLWTGITVVDGNNTSNTGTLTYAASYPIREGSTSTSVTGTTSTTWNKGATLHALQAADFNGDGTPDLWAVDDSGTVSATAVTGLSTTLDATTLTAGASQTLSTATHSWALNDYTGTGTSAGGTATDNTSGTALNLAGTGSPYTNTGDQFSPDVAFPGTSGYLAASSDAIDLTGSFTVSAWVKPGSGGCMALSQDGSAYPGVYLASSGNTWALYLAKDNGAAAWDGDTLTGGTVQPEAWAHLQATYNKTTKVMSLYVDDTLVAYANHTAPSSGAVGDFRLGSNIDNKSQANFCTGQIAEVQTWNGAALAPNQPYTAASYHQSITPERILDTRYATGDNLTSGTTSADTPVAADSTTTLQIVGDTVTPTVSGAPTAIPATATAVAADITLTSEAAAGALNAYADGTQRPITSSTNYYASTTITGYQVIPLGLDGKIDLYNASSGTTHLIVDLTGYFTSNATLTGDQTYHPLASAYHAVDTGTSLANTSLTGSTPYVVPASTTFTMNVTGVDSIPSNATGVAVNFTTSHETTGGFLEVYPTGTSPSADTALTYQTNFLTSMSADVPIGTGGTITIANEGGATRVMADISGYYTTDTSGQVYHTVNPTRLVDTRSGVGGSTGAIAATSAYVLTAANAQQITTANNPTVALMVTETDDTGAGVFTVYPDGATRPNTLNLSWASGQTIANFAVTPEGADGAIDIYNGDTYTTQLVVDCSGYFADN